MFWAKFTQLTSDQSLDFFKRTTMQWFFNHVYCFYSTTNYTTTFECTHLEWLNWTHYANERCSINSIKQFSLRHFIAKATQRYTNVIASWTQLCIIDLCCAAWLLSSRIVNGWHSKFHFTGNRNKIVFTYPCHSIPTSYRTKLGELTT